MKACRPPTHRGAREHSLHAMQRQLLSPLRPSPYQNDISTKRCSLPPSVKQVRKYVGEAENRIVTNGGDVRAGVEVAQVQLCRANIVYEF